MILDSIAASRFSYNAGASGTVVVPAGAYVTRIVVHGGSSATLVITPGGANQQAVAGDPIPLATSDIIVLDFLGQLGPGTSLVFTSTTMYLIMYATFKAG